MKKGKYVYYHCTGGRGKCDQPYVREEVLDSKLAEIVKAIQIDFDVADWIIERAHSLYLTKETTEKRKLLNCVLSNCTLDGVTLYPTYKKPFDMIAEGVKTKRKYPRQDSNLLPSA